MLISKGIGHFLRNENKQVIIDLGLTTNELLVFEDGNVTFVDKKSIRDSLVINSGQLKNLTET